jgi:hypothetical protein
MAKSHRLGDGSQNADEHSPDSRLPTPSHSDSGTLVFGVSNVFDLQPAFNSGYGWGMTVEAIKDAIVHLSEEERKQLADWFEELEEAAWDRQMERDFAPGGRRAHLLEKVDRQIDAGNFTSLEEGLRRRREQQSK